MAHALGNKRELTSRAKGSFSKRRSVLLWKRLISLSAFVPGLYLRFLPTGTGSPAMRKSFDQSGNLQRGRGATGFVFLVQPETASHLRITEGLPAFDFAPVFMLPLPLPAAFGGILPYYKALSSWCWDAKMDGLFEALWRGCAT